MHDKAGSTRLAIETDRYALRRQTDTAFGEERIQCNKQVQPLEPHHARLNRAR